ncbi:Exonuclease family protein [Prunus dulcis]|uniref:Exonuclease family protein n=1 Tax=Prunus dulcis TaxID=3755 RepID=A0A4Y1QW81_PRUDU|nr:Exonuclease family protein [Prunus dulcis]
MCRLSAPVSLGTTMEPCEEFKYDINSSKENHIGDGTEAIALDCEMVAGGSDGSLPACKGTGLTGASQRWHATPKVQDKGYCKLPSSDVNKSGFHDPYEDCVSAMRLYKRFRGLDQQKEGNVASLATMRAKDIPRSFDSWETDKQCNLVIGFSLQYTYLKDQQACITSNVNTSTSSINGSEATNEKWFVKPNVHVPPEGDPLFPFDHGNPISQSSRFGVQRTVTWVRDLIVYDISSYVVAHLPRKSH